MSQNKVEIQYTCASCGNSFSGRFCNHCGEKRVEKSDLTIVHFLTNIWRAITFTDTKFLKSFWFLLVRPGQLTQEYFRGRRKLYALPFSMFFFVNLIYFIYQPVDTLNSQLSSQIGGQPYSSWAKVETQKKMEEKGMDYNEIKKAYASGSEEVSKLILFTLIIFYAAGLFLVNFHHQKLLFFHLVQATHFITFTILLLLILMPLVLSGAIFLYVVITGDSSVHVNPNSIYFTSFFLIVLTVYNYISQQRLFNEKKWFSLVKAFLLFPIFFGCIILYRLSLFSIVMSML